MTYTLTWRETATILVSSAMAGTLFAWWLSQRPEPIYRPGSNE